MVGAHKPLQLPQPTDAHGQTHSLKPYFYMLALNAKLNALTLTLKPIRTF